METPVVLETRPAEVTQAEVARSPYGAPYGTAAPACQASPAHTPLRNAARRLRLTRRSAVSALRGLPAWVLLVQLFIGAGWLRAAAEKVIDPTWWSGAAIRSFAADHASSALPWYRGVLDMVVLPNVLLISVLVVLAQLLAGAALITGRRVATGLVVGVILNLNFVAAGAVNPSIFYLVCQAALLLWIVQHRTPAGSTGRLRQWVPATSLALVALSAPFITSVDPAAVIDDPAMVLAFFGALLGVSTRLGIVESASQAEAGPVHAWLAGRTASQRPPPVRSDGQSCRAATWLGAASYGCAIERW